MSTNFEQAYTKLNKLQKQAVDTIEGPIMVVAGPGTGKTQILTLRIANILLNTQIEPENILALTFTESGVLAMRKRLVDIIGTPGYKVEINTFHGFCNDIIKNNGEEFDKFIAATSITEIEQIQILEKIIDSLKLEYLKPFNEPFFYLKSVLSAINDLKKEGIPPETFTRVLLKQQADFEKIEDLYHQKGAYKGMMKGKYVDAQKQANKNLEVAKIYAEYQQKLVELKVYDFNDMLLDVVTFLENNKNLLLKLQEKYQYILVDEHQDTNSAQNKLIELLCSYFESPNLFVVGDEKQAIFRFQGASLENFLYFKKLYPNAVLISLADNYRSSQTILDAAGSIIKQNLSSQILMQQDLIAQTGLPDEEIAVASLGDYFAEMHFVALDIKTKIADGVMAKEIAILGRNNRDLLAFANVLEQNQIPFVIESDQNIFVDSDVRKLLLLLKAVGNFGSDIDLIPVLHIDFFRLDQLDVYKLINRSATLRVSIYELLSDPEKLKEINLQDPEKLQNIFIQLMKWNTQSSNDSLDKLFIDIINESGLRVFILSKPNCIELLDKIASLFEEVKLQIDKNPLFNLTDFLNYLILLQTHEVLIKKPVKTILKDAVRLMTAHKSKGLEFDYVYIVNAFDGHWGNKRKHAQQIKLPWDYLGIKLSVDFDEIEDERRLFYVSLTRARKGVIITYSTAGLDGKEQIPSQFIDEINARYRKSLELAVFEKDFLAHKELILAPNVALKPDLKNIKFIKGLFLERGLSITSLNNFLDCPWKYFYRNLLQLPDVKSPSMLFGLSIHKALNDYIKALKTPEKPDEQFLLRSFNYALALQMQNHKEFERYVQKGERALKVYYDQRASKWSDKLMSEMKINGIKLSDDVVLNGRIDMLEPTTNRGEVMVYDFKTGSPKTRNVIAGLTANSDGGYKRQLVFYKILLDKYYQGKYKMREGVIEFIEPDVKDRLHRESFIIEDQEVKVLEAQIMDVADQIINLKFWDQVCGQQDCEYCALRKMMDVGR